MPPGVPLRPADQSAIEVHGLVAYLRCTSAAVEEHARAAQTFCSEFGLDFPGEESSVPIVRATVRRICQSWDLPDDTPDVASLLVTEVVTNAVQASPKDVLRVSVRHLLTYLYVDCTDYSPEVPRASEASWTDEAGRGLHIIASASLAYGWSAPDGVRGKVFWFTLAA